MSLATNTLHYAIVHPFAKRTAFAILATIALGSAPSWAYTGNTRHDPGRTDPREYRAEVIRPTFACLPANGAEILGGFAGPSDLVNPVTGEVCHSR